MSTKYDVMTPAGMFSVTWPDEPDAAPTIEGNDRALTYFREFLTLEMVTGTGGNRLTLEGIEPADLYGFCQSDDYGIVVIPDELPLDEEDDDLDAECPA